MAKKKMNGNGGRLPTLQIPVTKELKADVEALALSCGYRQVSEFLLPIIQKYVEVNQERLNRYRKFISAPASMPMFNVSDEMATPADESAGVDNAEK